MSINLQNNERVNVNDVHRLVFDVFSTIMLRYSVTCQKLNDKYSSEVCMPYLGMISSDLITAYWHSNRGFVT